MVNGLNALGKLFDVKFIRELLLEKATFTDVLKLFRIYAILKEEFFGVLPCRMLKLADVKPGTIYFAYGKPTDAEDFKSKVFMVILKKRKKYHILRVVIEMQEGWDQTELLNFHIERIRILVQKKHYPKSKHALPAKVIDYQVELDDFIGCTVE